MDNPDITLMIGRWVQNWIGVEVCSPGPPPVTPGWPGSTSCRGITVVVELFC